MTESRARILILGALTAFAPMSIDLYLPALPALAQALVTTDAAVQFSLAAFFVGFAGGQLLYGPLADRYGRKPPLYFGLLVYVAASLGCALAPNIATLVVLRFVQALGACAAAVISRAMVRDLFEGRQAAQVFSTLMLVMGVAPILAPLIGGYILVWLGWRAIFWALALFGLACLAAAHSQLPETRRASASHSLALGPVLARYGHILANRRFTGYALAGGVSMGGLFAYLAASPFVFIELFGISVKAYGWLFGANAFGLILASQVNHRLLRRLPSRVLMYRAGLVQALCGLALLAAAWTRLGGLTGILVPLFGYLACIGLIIPNTSALAMAEFRENTGSASALLGTLQFGVGAIASALVGSLHTGTAVPMAATVAGAGVVAILIQRVAAGHRKTSGS